MPSILVICTGNICRSPMAEGFLRTALRRRFGDRAPTVASAGTTGWEGSGAMPESVEAAGERGVDISGHVARRLTRGDVFDADVVVAMAAEHREAVSRAMPEAADRTFTLKELVRLLEALPPPTAPLGPDDLPDRLAQAEEVRRGGFGGNPHDEDIVDPLGLPLESFRAIAWELDEWTARLAQSLYGSAPAAAAAGLDEEGR
jgi:low molecular weight protein-tyrosine phosphatase